MKESARREPATGASDGKRPAQPAGEIAWGVVTVLLVAAGFWS